MLRFYMTGYYVSYWMLGKYLSNIRIDHWKVAKWFMQFLLRIKDYMLIYRRSNQLEVIRYTDFDFAGCQDNMKSTLGYIYLLAGGAVSSES